jgi:hypothetical protein
MWQRYNSTSHIFEKSVDNGANWSPLGLSAAIITEGTISPSQLPASIAYINISNQFVADQILVKTAPRIWLNDSSQPANLKIWDILNNAQRLKFSTSNDSYGTLGSVLELDRIGNAYVGAAFFERGRTTAVGYWTNQPFSASEYTVSGGTGTWTVGAAAVIWNRYTVIGKTMHWSLYISWFSGSNVLTGAATALAIRLPGGLVANASPLGAVPYGIDSNVRADFDWSCTAGGNVLTVNKKTGAAFGTTPPGIIATVTVEIQ